ncbi:MAG: tail completion protein gp17 [Erythrobacter sp.]
MENALRAALIDWLRTDPVLATINTIEEEAPLRAAPPWLGIAASAAADWGCKDRAGREVRIALELASRADHPAADAAILAAIETRVLALPPFSAGFELASVRFLRSRSEARANNLRAALLEFRFRIFAPLPE